MTLPEPLKFTAFAVISPPILKFLVVSKTVAVAALPDVFWLPAWLTPGRFIFADPLKLTPPIVLVFASIVAVPALPDILPVTLPVKGPENAVAVAVPVTVTPALDVINFLIHRDIKQLLHYYHWIILILVSN